MDTFGQVISCNFPYFGNPEKKINSFQKAKDYSDSLMVNMNQNFKKEKYKIDLNYNKEDDALVWQICYLRGEEKNIKDYHCMLINAHYNILIKEQGMLEQQIDCNCCDTGVDIKNKE